jgi:hypothetical protein
VLAGADGELEAALESAGATVLAAMVVDESVGCCEAPGTPGTGDPFAWVPDEAGAVASPVVLEDVVCVGGIVPAAVGAAPVVAPAVTLVPEPPLEASGLGVESTGALPPVLGGVALSGAGVAACLAAATRGCPAGWGAGEAGGGAGLAGADSTSWDAGVVTVTVLAAGVAATAWWTRGAGLAWWRTR